MMGERPAPLVDRDNLPGSFPQFGGLAYVAIALGLLPTALLIPDLFRDAVGREDVAQTLVFRFGGAIVIFGAVWAYGILRSVRLRQIARSSSNSDVVVEGIWDLRSYQEARGVASGFSIRTYVVVVSVATISIWQGFRKPRVVASFASDEVTDLFATSSSERSPVPSLRIVTQDRRVNLLLLQSTRFAIRRLRADRAVEVASRGRTVINRNRTGL